MTLRNTCEDCKKYSEELEKIGLITFLHKYIDNTCIADSIFDYVMRLMKR
jgi:hypothetical protein